MFEQECSRIFIRRANCSLLIIFHDIFDGHSINNGHNYRLLLYFILFTFIAYVNHGHRATVNGMNLCLSSIVHMEYFLRAPFAYCPAFALMHRFGQLYSYTYVYIYISYTARNEWRKFPNFVYSASHYYLISSVNRTRTSIKYIIIHLRVLIYFRCVV